MDGPLLSPGPIGHAADVFLPVHITCLLLIALFCPAPLFTLLAPANCILTAVLTLALPLVGPSTGRWLLMLLGASGAFVAISACMTLRQSPRPLLAGAGGLILANLLFYPISRWPGGGFAEVAAVAVFLAAIPFFSRPAASGRQQPVKGRGLWPYLVFFLVFQIVSGLMYSFLMPSYHQMALLPGVELLFYVLAVAAAYWGVQKNQDLALVSAVILAMAAYTLLQVGIFPLPINTGMFAMQAAAGIIDLAVLAILLSLPEPVRTFGTGLAAVCTGILAGKLVGYYFADTAQAIALAGHIVLNVSILTLYFLGRYFYFPRGCDTGSSRMKGFAAAASNSDMGPSAQPNETTGEAGPDPDSEKSTPNGRLPDHLRLLLSQREYLVLERAYKGMTYRDTARELEISESTVKTYMSRIYEKMGVKGKKKLFETLNKI
ncbi:MAG: helix-turn-helix transcriptional regulator [Desulfosarcinaceae bacterium]